MRVRLGSGLVVAATVAAFAFTAGCGDNENKVIILGSTPTPTRTTAGPTGARTATPTPATTATPGQGAQRVVTLSLTSSGGLQGFTLRVEYPTAKGGFAGSADSVECTSSVQGFTPNDLDNGTMLLVAGSATNLTLPVDITCNFDEVAGQSLSTGDVNVVVQSVTENGAAGNTAHLSVAVAVS